MIFRRFFTYRMYSITTAALAALIIGMITIQVVELLMRSILEAVIF